MKLTSEKHQYILERIQSGYYEIHNPTPSILLSIKNSKKLYTNKITFSNSRYRFEIKKNKPLNFIKICEFDNFHIIYFFNHVYCKGEFIEINNNLYEKLLDIKISVFNRNSESNKDNYYTWKNWQGLFDWEDYIKNYKHPSELLKEIESKIITKNTEIEYLLKNKIELENKLKINNHGKNNKSTIK